jgi:hypothetical protein
MKLPLRALVLLALTCMGCSERESSAAATTSFDSPGAAAAAFAEAVRSGDQSRLSAMLGPESTQLLNPGDTVQGGNERKSFLEAYDSQRLLVPSGEAFILEVGPNRWPLPMPIVKGETGWKFDTQGGLRELVLRRVGRNELAVLGVMRGIVAAQQEYRTKFGVFAARLRSEPGKQDGLYWEAAEGDPESPAGPLLAWAEAQGYTPGGEKPAPYRGYFYRRLTVTDPAREFAIVAYPAEYGASGIMTFVVNQDGAIYRRNLGADTASAAEALTAFAPDDTWTREP